MNLLYANDTRGRYPDSWYAATSPALPPFAPLDGDRRADVCVIGAGFTGLSAALHLAEAGLDVVVLDAHRAGFGASGRNGGQLGSGQRVDQQTLETRIGRDDARRMWRFGQDAKALVRDLAARHNIDCALRDGIAEAGSSPRSVTDLHGYAAHMARHYDYEMTVLDRDAFHDLCPSPRFCGGIVDEGAAHLHPLRLALGLAQAATKAGACLCEQTPVTQIRQGARVRVQTPTGTVEADTVLVACNGYLGGLDRTVAAHIIPINNYIVATEPLGPRAQEVLTRDIAAIDDRFVVNYWRLSEDGRLLFGGGESYGKRFPRDIRALVRKPLLQIYPHLHDVRLDYAWGGTLAITMTRLPHLAKLAPNILSASGYSGHGVGNAVQAGRLMAEAIRGHAAGFDAFAALPVPRFPGGPALRTPLATLAMTWFALRDRLGF